MCFYLNRVEKGNDDSLLEAHYKSYEKISPGEVFLYSAISIYFCQNIVILSRDPVPLRRCILFAGNI
jgi:hypothetical protein